MPTQQGADSTESRRALFKPDSMVDHFRIMRLLGRGGMGEVYLARDIRLGRKVALKVIHPEQIGSDEATERFLFEAQAVARFSHPNIVTIYAVGEFCGSPYVALEYLEGQTLRQRIRDDRPSIREAMRLVLSIAQALKEAHHNNVLHRDLKPENALIARDGRLRVVDFGLAKIVASKESSYPEIDAASAEEVRGTPAYMAPEQWMEREASEATDIWSLGVILYELIAGHAPYQDSTVMELALKVCGPEPVPAIETSQEVPSALFDMTHACLAKLPAERPAAREVVQTLEGLLASRRREEQANTCPFRGLLPFSERHAEFFFGREAEIDAFLERMREQPVLPVVGPSGAGKSSFVQAGIIPRLREQGPWVVLQIRPGDRPFLALASRLLHGESTTRAHTVSNLPTVDVHQRLEAERRGERPEEPRPDKTPESEARLAQQLREAPSLLNLMLHQAASKGSCRVLLLVDQLEEIYTLVEDEELRARFMHAICAAADDPQDPVRVVFTIRDDFMVRVAEGPEAREVLSHVTVLRSPDPANLERTLVQPLEELDYSFDDPELPAEMVAAVREEPAALPLLQFVTRMLWDQRDARRRRLLRSAYDAAGGMAGALARHADGVLEGLAPSQVNVAREMLLRLVTVEGTRRVLPREQVLEGLGQPAQQVLGRLTLSRLITVRKATGGGAELELAHESLVRTWGRLARWIDESHEDLAFIGEVTQAAQLWSRRGRRDDEVWHGDALHEARRHVERCTTQVPDLVLRFLEAGNSRERRMVRRRRLRVALGFVLLAAMAVLALLVALALSHREKQARHRLAEVQREGARSALQRGDLLEARAKLRASLETQDSPLARALWWRLQQEPLVWRRTLGSFVYEVAVSPDGKTVAASCQDKSIYLMDIASTAVRVLRGHGDQVFSLAFSPDGKHLASGTWSGEVWIWDWRQGNHKVHSGHTEAVWSLDFSPDGQRLASASYDHTVRIWREGAAAVVLRGHSDRVRWVRFSPDGGRLVTAGYDHTVRVWDSRSGRQTHLFRGHTDRVYCALFLPDGQRIVSSSMDRCVRLWDLARPERQEVLIRHDDAVFGLALSPDGKRLAYGSADHKAYVWNMAQRRREHVLRGHTAQLYSINFSPDGKRLVTGSVDKAVCLWDPGAVTGPRIETGHTSSVYGIALSPDGTRLASSSYDKTVRLWDVRSGAETAVLRGHTGVIFNVRFSPDGRQLASASLDKTVRLWDVARGVEQRVLAGHDGGVTDLGYTPDGRQLASAGWDKTVRLWDPASGAQQRVLTGHTDRVVALAVSPDGRQIASGSTDKSIRVWDVASGEVKQVLTGHADGIYGLDYSPDGKHLISGSTDKTIRIWELQTGTSRVLDRLESRVYWLHYHPDGQRVCAPLSDGTARIYELATGGHTTLRGHRSEVNFCVFSGDGKLVATSSDDNTVRLWNAADGRTFWRAPLLLGRPPELLSHQGWSRLDARPASGARGPASGPTTAWRRNAAHTARLASELTVSGESSLCLLTHESVVEIWDTKRDLQLTSIAAPDAARVLALPGGCLVLTRGSRVQLIDRSGQRRELADNATAIAWDHDRQQILVTSGRQVLFLSSTGAVLERRKADVGVQALMRTDSLLVLGFEDGNIELVPLAADAPRPSFTFEKVPSSAVVRLLEGPMGTLIVGYANGMLGIWNLTNGARLHHVRLHGPVVHLLLRDGKLYAATELGQSHVLDLGPFRTGYCDILRQVWRHVPATWEGGLPVHRPPPRRHRCLR